jgi:hypothetical protein
MKRKFVVCLLILSLLGQLNNWIDIFSTKNNRLIRCGEINYSSLESCIKSTNNNSCLKEEFVYATHNDFDCTVEGGKCY